MKRMKKILAMVMSLAMIMGMQVMAFADPGDGSSPTSSIPASGNTAEVTIMNVEKNVTIKAYQIVEAMYNTAGFYGYKVVDKGQDGGALNLNIGTDAVGVKDKASEVASLAKKATTLQQLKSVTVDTAESNFTKNTTDDLGSYKVSLNPGYWLVLITGGKEVYNPMLAGVYYSKSGSSAEMSSTPLNANDNWTLNGAIVYAKSSEVKIEKTADKETQNLGGTVRYTVKTTVPYYSNEYDSAKLKFKITDTLTGLSLNKKADQPDEWDITVYSGTIGDADDNIKLSGNQYQSGGDLVASGVNTWSYDGAPTASQYKIDFKPAWIKDNGGKDVVIVYSATLTDKAIVNQNPHTNTVSLNYTNNPSDESGNGKAEDKEKVYTFDIDGETTGTKDLITKTKKENGTEAALEGAEFTLYVSWNATTNECSNQYTNTEHPETKAYTASSNATGKLHITGLAAGTYYLKETKAPNGFTLNDTVYKIVIDPTINGEELTSWTITISEAKDPSKSATNTFTPGTTASAQVTVQHKAENDQMADGTDETKIQNTQISTLPSTGGMGTTIFTIGGCIIMIAAAGLFFASRRKTSAK